ncbi:MAG: ABC transporter ATP-binding protein, partial [Candidatus Saccharibacteria bacterium]
MKLLIRETIKIFWNHSKPYKWMVALQLFGLIGGTLTAVFEPVLVKQLFDKLSSGLTALNPLLQVLWWLLALELLGWLMWRLAIFANNRYQSGVMSDLLNTCFKYLQGHSFNFFNNNFGGSLVRRVNRFERAFEDITDEAFWAFGQAILRMLAILVVLYYRRPVLATVIILWVAVYIAFTYAFTLYKQKYELYKAETDTKVSGHLADTVTNNINIKLFGGLTREYDNYRKLTGELARIRRFTWDLSGIAEAVQTLLIIGLEIGMFYLAIVLWRRGILTVGDFALVQMYLMQIFGRLWELGRNIRRFYERFADAEEMTQVLLTPHEVQDRPGAKTLEVNAGEITFRDVTFGYQSDRQILDKFNLSIRRGERLALIGPSGGGKTTIVKLLLRFFDLKSGTILIDGQDIAAVTQESLRGQLSLVPQEPVLFHRSLYDNIRYAKPDASKEEIYRASELAHCHEFIMGCPEQYDTFVGERGVKLSGGERQRVAIARAILKDSPILILDEATSSLDSESEHLIQDALKNLMSGKTTIAIAHRLSTIMQMDRILVLESGKVTEEGKHEELLKIQQGTYQKL